MAQVTIAAKKEDAKAVSVGESGNDSTEKKLINDDLFNKLDSLSKEIDETQSKSL